MGLFFYPRIVRLPSDHCIHKHIAEFPSRYEKQRFVKDWTVEGPFEDEYSACHYFMLKGQGGICEQHSIDSDAFLFSEKEVNNWISKLIARCMEIELTTGVAARLLGKSQEEVDQIETQESYIVSDYSHGTGEVSVRRPARDGSSSTSHEKGGLILP